VFFEWFICLRYLKAKQKQGFISIITLISILGVMVGVCALIVVLAVMTGFTEGLREKILGVNSHIVVHKIGGQINDYKEVIALTKEVEGVKTVTPYLYSQAMLTSGEGGTGAIIRGIDLDSVEDVLTLSDFLKAGRLEDLKAGDGTLRSVPNIVLGEDLAHQLHVKLHDRVRLLSSSGPLTPMGIIPKILTCEVVGLFKTGMYEYDSVLAYVSLSTAQRFLELNDVVHGLEIKVDNIEQADLIGIEIQKKLGFLFVAKDWMQTNVNLFSALELEKTALFIILVLIVLVAAFNIISTLIMVVMEKSKDIAILKSMGATAGSIMRIFIYEGLIIGFSGTILGVISGLGLCEFLRIYGSKFIKLPEIYPNSTVLVKVLPNDVIIIAVSAVIITFLATIYPSWKASRVEPATALRY
jgi:lipoprotein-releasing system permease protein